MNDWKTLDTDELNGLLQDRQAIYERYRNRRLRLDMSRGKPCPEQLELSMGMLDAVGSAHSPKTADGTDTRNYGGLDGIPEAKELFAQMLEVQPDEVIVGGSSSLTMMHDAIARAMLQGVLGSAAPWGKLSAVKFLCPSPGYDRHFAICELFGIEMIVVEMKHDGPDMDAVEKLVGEDESIKGIWCVPKYSNPDGITYSDEVVDRLARMQAKAADFRIFWDNAYAVHHVTDHPDRLKPILEACKAAGNPDRVFLFSSTSKISFSGAGVAAMSASVANLNQIRKALSVQTIGPDKINQLRHVRFFGGMDGIKAHMDKHAAIMKPKFDTVLSLLETELGDKGIASWNKPNGGYFISLNTLDGCAKEVVAMAAEAGVTLTKAGATYPYGRDPRDRNIRIAPSYPTLSELGTAIEILCVCVQIAGAKKLLSGKQ
ncbi:aminotransferase class I/II-fold pyridoxal phosphate-dependent enzyme [Paenibacillus hemerocallicola]|uniref:Aminotransferase class I/II-fold pyridoxal phosphate-dependent enzyme n=1 Tax=Paenibacillus hemerocallicola TaxID=1172614 RepID=A0A5C4SXR9_9BACL|nr:aminotransferase class I/II-fold pyridoxal phosphate-dependent enzyme [Paenibacillus hemerocallicola]TNJ60621.1 aminotransferase class I/II-fold pyridoxal phosphate-dependent enzyme [Paenibacillus hemerocallicola]